MRFDLDGLQVQGAWWNAGPEQRDRYRAAVADRPGAGLQRITDDLRARSFEIAGDRTVRVPRGYPIDHHRAELLRHRSLFAVRRLGLGAWLHDRRALDRLQAVAEELRPLLEWCSDHVVGVPTEP